MQEPEKNRSKTAKSGSSRMRFQNDEAPIASLPNPHIPPGEYTANCISYKAAKTFNGRRDIFISFEIYDSKYEGAVLFMACTYSTGEIRPRHKYYQQWTLAAGRQPNKKESLSPEIFPGRMYRVLVRDTQKRHADVKLMADCVQYSVVESIIEPLTGGQKP